MTAAHLDIPFAPGVSFDWESYRFPVTSTIYEVDTDHRILWGGTVGGITGVHEWPFTPSHDGCMW